MWPRNEGALIGHLIEKRGVQWQHIIEEEEEKDLLVSYAVKVK